MTEETFLRLSRRFFSNPLWEEPRAYSRAEAWLDCLRTAAWEKHRRVITGTMIEVPRGGFVASVRYLSDRWQWSKTKVCGFLDLLESEKMITREKGHQITVVCLCNYDQYNPRKGHEKDSEETPKGHPKDKVEEDIEEEEKKKERSRAPKIFEFPDGPLQHIDGLAEEMTAFIAHRKQIKKPLTDRAIELTIGKLAKRPHQAIEALQMAIEKGWQSIEWDWFDRNAPQKPTGERVPTAFLAPMNAPPKPPPHIQQ